MLVRWTTVDAQHQGSGAAETSATVLLDGNVLAALVDEACVHHALARAWFSKMPHCLATCPITQGPCFG